MKELVTVILGNEIEQFDGKRIDLSCDNSHKKTLIKIIERLGNYGFSSSINYSLTGDEIAADYAALGHVVIFNANNKLFLIKLPETLTEKQVIELKKIEQEIKNSKTYEQTINKKGNIVNSKEFKLNYNYNYKKNNNQ